MWAAFWLPPACCRVVQVLSPFPTVPWALAWRRGPGGSLRSFKARRLEATRQAGPPENQAHPNPSPRGYELGTLQNFSQAPLSPWLCPIPKPRVGRVVSWVHWKVSGLLWGHWGYLEDSRCLG